MSANIVFALGFRLLTSAPVLTVLAQSAINSYSEKAALRAADKGRAVDEGKRRITLKSDARL